LQWSPRSPALGLSGLGCDDTPLTQPRLLVRLAVGGWKRGQRAAKTDRRTRYGQCGPASTRCPACTIMSHDQQRAGPIDVGMWLRGLGLGQYEAAFRENETDNAVSRVGRTASSPPATSRAFPKFESYGMLETAASVGWKIKRIILATKSPIKRWDCGGERGVARLD